MAYVLILICEGHARRYSPACRRSRQFGQEGVGTHLERRSIGLRVSLTWLIRLYTKRPMTLTAANKSHRKAPE